MTSAYGLMAHSIIGQNLVAARGITSFIFDVALPFPLSKSFDLHLPIGTPDRNSTSAGRVDRPPATIVLDEWHPSSSSSSSPSSQSAWRMGQLPGTFGARMKTPGTTARRQMLSESVRLQSSKIVQLFPPGTQTFVRSYHKWYYQSQQVWMKRPSCRTAVPSGRLSF